MQPSPAAITYARKRAGWQVMQKLMEAVAGPLAGQEQDSAFVSGMRLVAIDGMCLDLPDTPDNAAEFGYPGNDGGRGPFPQVRVVGIGECGTRAVAGAELSPLAAGEQQLARRLIGRLSRGDLLLGDRNFLGHALLKDVLAAGVHVLWRAKSDVSLPVLEVLPDGTWLSRIADPDASRKMRRRGARPQDIPGITVRVIEYSVTSADGSEVSETFTLITDILDPEVLSCEQAAAAYARRWQLEMVFTQLTKRAVRPVRGDREHVADLDFAVGDDHAVDEQLGELPPLGEGGGGQPGPDGLAECLDPVGDGGKLEPLLGDRV
jgi:hypothetical protein